MLADSIIDPIQCSKLVATRKSKEPYIQILGHKMKMSGKSFLQYLTKRRKNSKIRKPLMRKLYFNFREFIAQETHF